MGDPKLVSWGDWLWNIGSQFSWHGKSRKIVILGLDGSGKSTLFAALRLDDGNPRIMDTPRVKPTYSSVEMAVENRLALVYDVKGSKEARPSWLDFIPDASAVVFVVDASDPGRFQEARSELEKLLGSHLIQQTPVLVLGNKSDLPGALDSEHLARKLGIGHNGRAVGVFACSAITGQGYGDALKWLVQHI